MAKGDNIFNCKEVYQAYADKILKENPTYWGKYGQRIKNAIIYKQIGKVVVEVISYTKFRDVIDKYFERARYYIIEGYELNLGNKLGVIAARRVERNFNKKVINYGATAKQPLDENGKRKHIIYHTEPDWCRIGWKKSGKVKDCWAYQFSPTPHDGQGNGFKYEFNMALQKNPLLRYRYEYFKYVVDNTEE